MIVTLAWIQLVIVENEMFLILLKVNLCPAGSTNLLVDSYLKSNSSFRILWNVFDSENGV